MKTCRYCKQQKQFIDFNKSSKAADGRRQECRECSIIQMRNWRLKNPNADRIYRQNNVMKVKNSVTKYRSSEKGRAKHSEIEAKRRAKKLQAMPSWLNQQHLSEIAEFYIISRELSWLSEGGLSVDHIVPLNGDIVCGLHVPWNLQIIPLIDNIKKSNRF